MFIYIDTSQDLDCLNKELSQKPYLAVDTEFRRTTKSNMRLALLQVNDGEEIYLIDPILIGDPGEQCSFLFSNSVIKVLHSCKEDIEAIYSWSGGVLENIFDTQLAEAFLNGEYSIGYQNLVEEKLGIILDKNETRSNWIRRPLTDSQLKYAATDVEFLLHLFLKQRKVLEESKKLDWHNEELELLKKRIFNTCIDEDRSLSKISKSEENNILTKFNQIVINIAEKESINPTLFFSKKSQKDFLRVSLEKSFEDALQTITCWRQNLIIDPIKDIFKEY